MQIPLLVSISIQNLSIKTGVADPGSVSGTFFLAESVIRDEFFRISDPEGMFFGEIFLRILVRYFFYPQDPG
jgi:hypothetical protein